jgi:hypothetical protein
VTCTEPPNPWISDTLDFWDQDKSGFVFNFYMRIENDLLFNTVLSNIFMHDF